MIGMKTNAILRQRDIPKRKKSKNFFPKLPDNDETPDFILI